MGYIPEPIQRDVIRGEMTEVDYHMPSIGDVLFEACRGVERPQGTVVLAGTVVDQRGRIVPEATVRVSWTGYSAAGGGRLNATNLDNLTATTDGFEASTTQTGFFRFCGVPTGTPLDIYAALGDDESEQYEITIPDYETGALHVLEIVRR